MGVAEDVEVFFPVGVAVAGVVGADGFAFEGVVGGLVEAGGEGVGEGVAFGGVAGPAGGGVPAGVVAGGVDVECLKFRVISKYLNLLSKSSPNVALFLKLMKKCICH